MIKKLLVIILSMSIVLRMSNATIIAKPHLPFLLIAPLKYQISVTGSFGELRNNHFHAGIDLRSAHGVEGDSIYSAADGFVKKIKIDSKNYGKSIYIEHPSGYTTVYAHCRSFRPDIEEKVKAEQYRLQKNELEIEFRPNDLVVKAGDSIAIMGNTGDSQGAHLHFELRITGTEEVLDPSEYGLVAEDNISPQFRKLKLYGFDLDGNSVSEKVFLANKIKSKILVPGEIFGVGVEAFDKMNNSWRTLGIKSLKLFIDHSLFYSFSMDHWSIEDARYINAHIDYKGLGQGRFQRCFKLQGNKIPIYQTVENDGFFYIGDGLEHQVILVISDASGNESSREFIIQNTSYISPVVNNILP
ncbi:MAG: M23 family metallopeptidase, partial [Saprospiraceae bacterium]